MNEQFVNDDSIEDSYLELTSITAVSNSICIEFQYSVEYHNMKIV